MGHRIIDAYDFYRANEDRLYDQIKNNPICNECGEIITNEFYYKVDGKNYCTDCMDNYKEYVCN